MKGRKSPMAGRKHLKETIKKMSEAKKGENHFLYGKVRPFIGGSPAQRIEVKDILTNESTIYDSFTAAATAFGIKQSTISTYFRRNQKKAYKGRLEFHRVNQMD